MTSDLQEVIAAMREYLSEAQAGHCVLFVTGCAEDIDFSVADLTRLLDAAEAGLRARDAALEEAARVAEAVDPEKPGNWLHARHKIAFAIRALKGAA